MKVILIFLGVTQIFFMVGNFVVGFTQLDSGRIAMGIIQMVVAAMLFVWVSVRDRL